MLENETGAVRCFANEEHAEVFADLLGHHGIELMKPGDEESVIRFYRQHREYLLPNATGLTSFLDGRGAQGAGLIDVAILRGDKELVHRLLWDELVTLTKSSPSQSEAAKLIGVANRFLGASASDADRREFHGLVVERLAQAYLGAEQPKAIDTLTLVIDTVDDREMQDMVFEAAQVRGQINAINRWGETPLTYACKQGKLDCVKLLLSHRADPALKNNEGQTARQIAEARMDSTLLKVIDDEIAGRSKADAWDLDV